MCANSNSTIGWLCSPMVGVSSTELARRLEIFYIWHAIYTHGLPYWSCNWHCNPSFLGSCNMGMGGLLASGNTKWFNSALLVFKPRMAWISCIIRSRSALTALCFPSSFKWASMWLGNTACLHSEHTTTPCAGKCTNGYTNVWETIIYGLHPLVPCSYSSSSCQKHKFSITGISAGTILISFFHIWLGSPVIHKDIAAIPLFKWLRPVRSNWICIDSAAVAHPANANTTWSEPPDWAAVVSRYFWQSSKHRTLDLSSKLKKPTSNRIISCLK